MQGKTKSDLTESVLKQNYKPPFNVLYYEIFTSSPDIGPFNAFATNLKRSFKISYESIGLELSHDCDHKKIFQ